MKSLKKLLERLDGLRFSLRSLLFYCVIVTPFWSLMTSYSHSAMFSWEPVALGFCYSVVLYFIVMLWLTRRESIAETHEPYEQHDSRLTRKALIRSVLFIIGLHLADTVLGALDELF